MSVLKGTIRNGQVVLEQKADWPDGTEVNIIPAGRLPTGDEEMAEEDWSNAPEAIADWLKWSNSLKPLILTPAEEADTEAWLRRFSDYGIAGMEKGTEDMFR
jgi:hypothetical protein